MSHRQYENLASLSHLALKETSTDCMVYENVIWMFSLYLKKLYMQILLKWMLMKKMRHSNIYHIKEMYWLRQHETFII